MSIDPYSSPVSHAQPPSFSTSSAISQGVLAQLAGTKPWVRFMSVLMFIGAGFMLLGALIMLVMGGTIAASAKTGGSALPAGMMTGISILYALFAGIYIYPALKLWKYASNIGALLISSSMSDLEAALSQQRSFWKFLGIMIISIFVLYFVIVIGVLAFGGFAAMKAQGA
jgi:hypothetical protein